MSTHTHTAAAHEMGRNTGDFSQRAQACLEAVRSLGLATDREVMTHLGFSDMNSVRPRLTELVQAGWLEEIGEQEDSVTHKLVRVLRVPCPVAQAAAAITGSQRELQRELGF